MKIIVIGTGLVGLVTGVCCAAVGIEVSGIIIDYNKIVGLKNDIVAKYEPGKKTSLPAIVRRADCTLPPAFPKAATVHSRPS